MDNIYFILQNYLLCKLYILFISKISENFNYTVKIFPGLLFN